MKWFLHGKGVGLGNFTNCTPFLKALSDKWGEPINVYSDNLLINFSYEDCDFLNFLDQRPLTAPFAHSRIYVLQGGDHNKYKMPDYEFMYKLMRREFGLPETMPHTYIDQPDLDVPKGVAFVNGSGAWSKEYLAKKIISNDIFRDIINLVEEQTICLGALQDQPLNCDTDMRGSSIRKQLAVIANASLVIANEGGLAHAAAAMQKPLFILWKSTAKIKNKNPFKGTFYSYDNHLENFKKWKQ